MKVSRFNVPFVLLAATALLAGLWAGLVRIGWTLPPLQPAAHGPLMISGFLGTLISLERAVALRWRWVYAAPLLSGAGALALVLGAPSFMSRGLIALSSLTLLIAFGWAYWKTFGRRWEWASVTMIVGVGCWLVGNGLWLFNRPLAHASAWWVGFLVLTIAGERLELARVQLLRRDSMVLFAIAVVAFLGGLVLALINFIWGLRLAALGLIALGLWLLRFDVARRTIRGAGLTRFIAACLLPGYVWLCVAGCFWLLWPDYFVAGPYYDAMLHTILLGFVFSMIFGHAPIIFPAVTGLAMAYQPRFYLHLALLHLSLILRLWGDLAVQPSVRAWGGMLNEVAILIFIGSTIWAMRTGKKLQEI